MAAITGLFGSKKQTQAPSASLRVQTSLNGTAIPLFLGGQNRLSCNLIWYGNFGYVNAPASGGGKGGVTGGGGKGQSGNYEYFADIMVAICEGQLSEILTQYINGSPNSDFGGSSFLGDFTQEPWGALEPDFPTQALAYRGLAYWAAQTYDLGSSASTPTFNWECLHVNNGAIPGQPDALPDACMQLFLFEEHYGIDFPSARYGDQSFYNSYCKALGLVVSPVVPSAIQASSFFTDMLSATNSNARWSSGLLTIIPYGDQAVTAGQLTQITETHAVPATITPSDGSPTIYPTIKVGFAGTWNADLGVKYDGTGIPLVLTTANPPAAPGFYCLQSPGVYVFNPADTAQTVDIKYQYAAIASFTPNVEPIYDFTLDDFMPNQGTIGSGLAIKNSPLIVVRKPRDQMLNTIKFEYFDRNNNYNPVDIEVKDQASIVAFGRRRPSDVKSFSFCCLASMAQQSAALMLTREQIARTYQWTAGKQFVLLDVMDIVTVTDAGQNIFRQPVRITEIQENTDFSYTFTAEEFTGTASAPQFGAQANSGYVRNFNVDPGPINPPVLFEPSDELGAGLAIWAAVSGQNTALWGGCKVYASYDGVTYQYIETINGPARMGVTTAVLNSVTVNATGQTIDQTNTLSVDLTESEGALTSGTVLDATSLNTRCYIGPATGGGEIVAFETATLTATFKYNLTYLVRGAYGTEDEIATWPAGSSFARLDGQIAQIPYDQSRIGATLYLKFQSFNNWLGGAEDISELPVFTYVITGSALASPLPNVANARTVFEAGFQKIWWDEVNDFRPGTRYQIKKGATFNSAQIVGDVAHPPLVAFGDATYWITAYCQPVAGLLVYSETPTSITIAGSMLTENVVETVNFAAEGWTGTFNGIGKEGTGPSSVLRLVSAGNILADSSILTDPDILNEGGITSSGTWTSDVVINTNYVGNCSVNVSWLSTGLPVGQNVLTIADFLNAPDILASASSAFTDAVIQIRTATTATLGVPNWGSWQSFVPGVYNAQYLQFMVSLSSLNSAVIGYLNSMIAMISLPARIDHYIGQNVTVAGLTIIFQPDNATTAQPFNGGPLQSAANTSIPEVQMSWSANADANYVIDSISLSQITFHFVNGVGSTIEVDGVTAVVEGY